VLLLRRIALWGLCERRQGQRKRCGCDGGDNATAQPALDVKHLMSPFGKAHLLTSASSRKEAVLTRLKMFIFVVMS
jgi:hypothetical protein